MTPARPLLLIATGDVAPLRPDLDSMFEGVRQVLSQGDFVFGQLEAPVSDRGAPSPNAKLAMRIPPAAAPAVAKAGFNAVSLAGNHCMDWGRDALLDTVQHAREAGLATCGAGANLTEARKPAVVERDGVKVAFLAYSSILPQGYRAENHRPGCAPMRAHTLYEQVETDQPGTPPRTVTFPHRGDLKALVEDVRRAKASADVVALSIHWGIHFVPAEIADYQRDVAYAAIDAGADLILGHHPHILKGVEMYRGKAIFYSLGNFAIEPPWAYDDTIRQTEGFKEISALNPGMTDVSLPEDSHLTMAVKAWIEGGRIVRVGFQPALIDAQFAPVMLEPESPSFARVVDYVREISAHQNLAVAFEAAGADILVCAAADDEDEPVRGARVS